MEVDHVPKCVRHVPAKRFHLGGRACQERAAGCTLDLNMLFVNRVRLVRLLRLKCGRMHADSLQSPACRLSWGLCCQACCNPKATLRSR